MRMRVAVALQAALVALGIPFECLNRSPSSLGLGFAVDAAAGAASILGLTSGWHSPT
jgi:hypothetical protein